MPRTPEAVITPGEICYRYQPSPKVAGLGLGSLVAQFDSIDGALINTDSTVGAESWIDNGLFVALDSLGRTSVHTGFAGCAGIGIHFCGHFFDLSYLDNTTRQKN